MRVLPNISRETTREDLTKLYIIISGNTDSVASNLEGGCHGHLAITTATEDYLDQMGNMFVPPHNTCNYTKAMGKTQ